MSKDNMKLWSEVCTTDPATTKHVAQRGGFTAICAQSQLKRATEMWGSYGSTWGVKDCTYRHVGKNEGSLPEEVMLTAIFYYPGGEFELAADCKWRAGDDTYKKVLTDLTTKGLSKLGFNSDVFEGKYEDNKYLSEVTEKYKASNPATDPFKESPPATRTKPSNERSELPADDSWVKKPQSVGKAKSSKSMSYEERLIAMSQMDIIATENGCTGLFHDCCMTAYKGKEYYRDTYEEALKYFDQKEPAKRNSMTSMWHDRAQKWMDSKGLTQPA